MRVSYPKLHRVVSYKSGAFAESVVFPDEFLVAEPRPSINILQGAILENLREVALVGYTQDGQEYVASTSNAKDTAYLFARANLIMLRQSDA